MEHPKLIIALTLFLLIFGFAAYHVNKPMPNGLSYSGKARPANDVKFLGDSSWVDAEGNRQVNQEIFDAVAAMIEGARNFILVDMFLYNDFQGPTPETTRALSGELTDALIAQKQAYPEINIIVITDPLNQLYGGMPSAQFTRLKTAGIPVVETKLPRLRDSNPAYSWLWRLFIRPFGNSEGNVIKNPIGPGKVSIRTYLALANFKANHRKIIAADSGDDYVGLVSSANPHDASSAHRNAAVQFTGPAVMDLIESENAVLKMSGHAPLAVSPKPETDSNLTVQIVTERQIKNAVLATLQEAENADIIDLMMFYLSDSYIVDALIAAKERGAVVRVLLDPNKDAFGHEKNGVPNRPVADVLHEAGIPVRWAKLRGEQSHAKLLIHSRHDAFKAVVISGSANYTRRNLNNLNLETDVVVKGPTDKQFFIDSRGYFGDAWHNKDDRAYSLPYEDFDDETWSHRVQYHFMEWSGMSTF